MSNNIENLFTQYYQILRAYALRYVQNQDAAEDIVQAQLWSSRLYKVSAKVSLWYEAS